MSSIYSPQPTAESLSVVHVVAGALFDSSGRVLIAQRPLGKHMAGGWEFPGGKVGANERPYDALVRELREELDIFVQSANPVITYTHEYADRGVLLDLWHITRYVGAPISAEGQPIKWVTLDELDSVGLLAADRPMIEPLRKTLATRL